MRWIPLIQKQIPNSHCPSSMVKLYLVIKWSSISVYILPRTWPGPLILILLSLNALNYVFLYEGYVQWTFTSPFYGKLLQPVLSLQFCIAHQSFWLDCWTKTLCLLKNGIPSLSTSSGVAYTYICKVQISQHFNSCTRLFISTIIGQIHPRNPCPASALSNANSRSSFKLLRYRTSLERNSLILPLSFTTGLLTVSVNSKRNVTPR